METLWGAIWSGLAIGAWYANYSWAVDGVVYFVLFTGLAKVSLGKRFEGRGGAAVIVAVGTALTVGAASLAYREGFTLARLGPFAWLLLVLLLGVMLFELARALRISLLPAMALAFLVMIAVAAGLGVSLTAWLVAAGLLPVLQMLALGAIGILAWWIVGPRWRRASGPTPPVEPSDASPSSTQPVGPQDALQRAVEEETTAAIRIETSTINLIGQLLSHLRQQGIGRHSRLLLLEIRRRERLVSVLYQRALRDLARSRWLGQQGRSRLPDELARILIAAKENVSAFDRHLDIAWAAHEAGNAPLLVETLNRLSKLEQAAIELGNSLRAVMARVKGTRAAP
jgi:hypothetical protein